MDSICLPLYFISKQYSFFSSVHLKLIKDFLKFMIKRKYQKHNKTLFLFVYLWKLLSQKEKLWNNKYWKQIKVSIIFFHFLVKLHIIKKEIEKFSIPSYTKKKLFRCKFLLVLCLLFLLSRFFVFFLACFLKVTRNTNCIWKCKKVVLINKKWKTVSYFLS